MTLTLQLNLGFAWGAVAAPQLVADDCDTFVVPADTEFTVLAESLTFIVPGCGS